MEENKIKLPDGDILKGKSVLRRFILGVLFGLAVIAPGVSGSFVMHLTKTPESSTDEIITMYLIRDAEGNLVSNATESRTWKSMWNKKYGKLTIPFMPEIAGTYTVDIFFNGAFVTSQSFEILAAQDA
jgi:uncharacterized membrane protein